ncbi:MAG: 1-deoxy-D-xylulose-5-phosphate reductoisomerase [Cellvibrionaceae bacterium]|nr:1-deoxy-D-xylulose-5-phosphate reductoisomerase [Cellvibrionaceae bacterium]
MASLPQQVTILGATGSIGVSTLDVIRRHRHAFDVFALTANTQVSLLAEQCLEFTPAYAVMGDALSAQRLSEQLRAAGCQTRVLSGTEAMQSVAAEPVVDTVMAAIVGGAGLLPTLAAVQAGKKVLLANKEALVMAGALFMEAVATAGATLLPIDSEHNAIFQCLPATYGTSALAREQVRKLLLTGSGGPFRSWTVQAMNDATPAQACRHPNWSMGQKISVDSATLMNKGLELIEACWLFDLSATMIDVVIHPQSIIHSMVEYVDGSILAQMGSPDMRIPIAHALAWPQRIESGAPSLDMIRIAQLDFEAPDSERFPALALARVAATEGGGLSTILNAANEVAVDAFLQQQIAFGQISSCLAAVVERAECWVPDSLDAVLALDAQARRLTETILTKQRLTVSG